jgi:hypothetical protein
MFIPHRKHAYGPPRSVTELALHFYVDNVRISQLTRLQGSTACYWDNFTFLYVHEVHTSQEAHLWASVACYGDSFTFLFVDVYTAQETRLWPPRSVTEFALHLYVDEVSTSQERPVGLTACYGNSFTFFTSERMCPLR